MDNQLQSFSVLISSAQDTVAIPDTSQVCKYYIYVF